jgi:hypothetical protein
MSRLAAVAGDDVLVETSRSDHERTLAAFEGYWSEAAGQYVYAFNEDSRLVEEITPWSAVGLMFGFGTDERARLSLQRMARADLTADWGVRMLSTESTYFEPLNYNYGAVWPFLTSWVTTAQFRRGLPMQAYSGLVATVGHVYNRSLGQVTEVMSGLRHTWPQESVPHQGFCTAGTVLPLVRGLLGLSTEGGGTRFAVRPYLPGDWDRVRVENYTTGETRLDLTLERTATSLKLTVAATGTGGQDLIFEPALAPGTGVGAVRVNGRTHEFDMEASSRRAAPSVQVTVEDELVIELELSPAFEILPPVWHSRIGDESDGLRVVDYTRTGGRATLSVQGRAGRTYRLEALHAETVSSVKGARLEEGGLRIDFPADERGDYVDHTIELSFD